MVSTTGSNQISIGNFIYKTIDPKLGINTSSPDATLSVNGDASKVGGGTWATFSDRRMKKDIQPFSDGLNVLNEINPVRYKYNGLAGYPDDGMEYIGVIAQDVEHIAPYMVGSLPKKLHEDDPDEADLLMYDASAMIYVLTNAVKEQQQMILELKKEVEELKQR